MSTEAEINAAHRRDAVPSKPGQNTRSASASMPQDLYDKLTWKAEIRGVTRAQVLRDAFTALAPAAPPEETKP